ncbi:unnamed protein product [Strongylus vulgaris]|uniref:Uncharacterized protein n=1 Tax=Strongylus vulgaris TaxID=40348 RepID=A0A3P7J9K0_STRVU|nr:unnamed protein product [Strongylus vulgaris]
MFFFVKTVLKKSSLSHAKVAELLQTSPEQLQLLLKDFNWTVLIPAFPPLNEEGIERTWQTIIQELSSSFSNHLDILDECQAWNAAMDEVMPCVRFSLHDLIYYTKSLRECIDKKTQIIHSRYIDKARLERRLSAKGIVDQDTFDLNRCAIYKRIKRVLWSKDSTVFRHLCFPLNARERFSSEKLQLLEACYRRLRTHIDGNELMTSLPRVAFEAECISDAFEGIRARLPSRPLLAEAAATLKSDTVPQKLARRSDPSLDKAYRASSLIPAFRFMGKDAAERELSWQPNDSLKDSARLRSLDQEHDMTTTEHCSYDIFGDLVDETILAGNINTNNHEGETLPQRRVVPSSSHALSAQHSPEPDKFLSEKEENSFKELEISIPSSTNACPKSAKVQDDGCISDLFSKEGWMRFLK